MKKTVSLRVGLVLAFALSMVVTAAVLGISIYSVTIHDFRKELAAQTKSLVQTVAKLIDVADFDKLVAQDDKNSSDYKKLHSWLQRVFAANDNLKFVYLMKRHDDRVNFIVDVKSNSEPEHHVNDLYTSAAKSMRAFLQNPDQVLVESELSTNAGGTFISGFAPIHQANGELAGAVRVDVDAQSVVTAEADIFDTILTSTRLTLLGILLGSFYLANRMSASLGRLSSEVQQIQKLDLANRAVVTSTFSEIANVGSAVEGMKKALRSFKKFVPSILVLDLLSLNREAELGTEKRQLTLLFSDIVDFTTISEQLTSKQLEQNMSLYFSSVLNCIKEHSGTIDKFIGDAVMSFWNAPKKLATHAVTACRAALACRREIHRINGDLQARGFPPFYTRFGLNTGECIVGNMGTEDRLAYTALGDTVNLASRIESINKMYGTEILVSESTYWLARDEFAFRAVDRVVVKGKTTEVQLYELVDAKANLQASELEQISRHNEAMDRYFAGAYEQARAFFRQRIVDRPGDLLTKNILVRLDERIAAPPSTKFRPVYLREK